MLRTQINRIRETMFQEEGVSVATILTAIGLAISTLLLALTGGGSTSVTSAPTPTPADKPGVKKWIKKHLNSLANVLKGLAGKAAAALPGIIGSIVSWLLKSAGKVAGWMAEHVLAAALAWGGVILLIIRDLLRSKPKQS